MRDECEEILEEVVRRGKAGHGGLEDQRVDLKACWYRQKGELAKDVCAFANSGGGFLLIGICEKPFEIVGWEHDRDEAMIQDEARRLLEPMPVLRITERNWDGRWVLCIEVISSPDALPYVARDRGGEHRVYIRKGTRNGTASHADLLALYERRAIALHDDYREAIACEKLGEVVHRLSDMDLAEVEREVSDLFRYTAGYGTQVAMHLLQIVDRIMDRLRGGLPCELASQGLRLASAALPGVAVDERVGPREADVLRFALGIFQGVAYRIQRYIHHDYLWGQAIRAMCEVGHLARLLKLDRLEQQCRDHLAERRQYAERDCDAQMVEYLDVYAQSIDGSRFGCPEMEPEIAQRFLFRG